MAAQFAIGHLIGEKSGCQFGTMLNTVQRDAAVIRIHATERYPKILFHQQLQLFAIVLFVDNNLRQHSVKCIDYPKWRLFQTPI